MARMSRPLVHSLAGLAFLLLTAAHAGAQDGAALYRRDCAACHDAGIDRAPARDTLQTMSAERVLRALETGPMLSMASRVSGAERRAIAQFVTGKSLSERDLSATPPKSAICASPGNFTSPLTGRNWNGWGDNTSNTRFQTAEAAGLTPAQASRLKVKWAFGFPGDLDANAQPSVVGGRVFVGSQGGLVYSLSADTGCIHWFFKTGAAVRGAVSVGQVTTAAGSTFAAFFGDLAGNIYAVNAATGAPLWTRKADTHPLARIVGSVVFHNGRLFVPVVSSEEVAGGSPTYECCTFRGSIGAYDGATGALVWKTYTIDEPKPTTKSTNGTQLYGPSGAGIWSSPTIDPVKNILYATTGDNYSLPASSMSDSFIALDRDTGRILWSQQLTAGDAWNTMCWAPDKANCPNASAPDHDFGSPPMLVSLSNGKRALVAGQKSGVVHAVDPDDRGKILWQQRTGNGTGTLGGVQWGSSADGTNVYVALSDFVRIPIPNTLASTADPKIGGGLFAFNLTTGQRAWYTAPAPCGTRPRCSPAQSAAVSAIPGMVFSGSVDGHLRGYSPSDGTVIFDFDAVGSYKTVNEVPARGGSFDGPGPAIAGGMLFVSSGYARTGGIPGNVLLALSVDGK